MTLAHAPGVSPGAWDPDPATIVLAVTGLLLYRRGSHVLRARRSRRAPSASRRASFYLGIVTGMAAIVSPLHGWSETLFAAHMVQHLALIAVVAPLVVLGRPTAPFVAALPARAARAISKMRAAPRRRAPLLLHPVTLWALHAIVLWAWHLPTLYGAALEDPFPHALEHGTFIATSMLVWAAVLGEHPIDEGRSVLLLFATGLQSAALGALLTFAGGVLYPAHEIAAAAAGFDPLADQQLAGVIMWIPPGILYLAASAVVLTRLLRDVPAPAEDARS